MLFPRNRMRFVNSYQGKSEQGGWVVLDLTGADLDGVSKIYLPGPVLEELRKRGDTSADRLKQARDLLGGDGLGADDEE